MVPSVYARRQTRGLSRINGCEDTVHGLHAGPRGRLSSYHDELARGRDVKTSSEQRATKVATAVTVASGDGGAGVGDDGR